MVELRAFCDGCPQRIRDLGTRIKEVQAKLDALDEFGHEMTDEFARDAYAVYAWPTVIRRALADAEDGLDEDKTYVLWLSGLMVVYSIV